MFRSVVWIACLLLPTEPGFGQSAKTNSSFEIADVHVSTQTRNAFLRRPVIRNGRYEVRFATMVDLISTAYGVEAEKVLGGPNWLENDLFDVIAKAPAGATVESARPMLQSLLADRFGLTLHDDTRPIPAYALKAGKHPPMKQAGSSGDSGCRFTPPPPPTAAGPPTTAPVLDGTGLEGGYDFTLSFSPAGVGNTVPGGGERAGVAAAGQPGNLPNASEPTGAISLSDAIEKQVGLKLEEQKRPVAVLVVDKAERTPTEN